MADKNGRERLGLYFNLKDEKEKELWDYLEGKFSKSVAIKEALKQAMEIEKAGQRVVFAGTNIAQNLKPEEEDYGVEQNEEF